MIETRAKRRGSYEGLPVWRGEYRITSLGNGMALGWGPATNSGGRPIAYSDRESALAGAQVCAEQELKKWRAAQ